MKKATFWFLSVSSSALLAMLVSANTYAIERDAVWVNQLDSTAAGVQWYDSQRRSSISKSLISPWLNQEVSGQRLNEFSADGEDSAVLHVPVGVDRFTQGALTVDGAEHIQVFINGEQIQATDDSYELTFQTGDHQLLVLTSGVESWSEVALQWQGNSDHDVLDTARPQSLRVNATQLFDAPTTTQLSLAPNGEFLLWQRQFYSEATGDTAQKNLQLVDVATRQSLYEWSDASVSQFAWHSSSQQFAYVEGDRIRLMDVQQRQKRTLTDELKDVGQLRWLNDTTLVFTLTETEDANSDQVKRYRALEDRWSYFRRTADVYTLNIENGVMTQLTDLQQRISLQDVSQNGESILLSQSVVDYAEPPHSLTHLLQITVASGEVSTIGQYRTFNQAAYASEGIYVVAGPEFAERAGRNLTDDEMLSNNYDGQLYWMNLQGEQVRALSRDFNPAVNGITVTSGDDLMLVTTDRDRSMLYQYNSANEQFSRIQQEVEVIDSFSVSQQSSPRIAFAGTSATAPQKVYVKDHRDNAQLWWDSADESYRLNSFTDVQEWNFTNSRGDTIYGRIYLPHDFDENNQYPALVYYYGGTTPVSRNFTGRYPFNLWADMGYVVYVLQPTGSIGFGQDFSARHVNAWGEDTVDDIIQGTQRFIDQHEFVDGSRVGNLGASYGGFMTMLLATKTDIFAASMSHAGISNLTSYWGAGWWGFGYSGEASKGSFPWNAPEVYQQRSPINFADQITNPLLLIHGDSDTNVPPVESHMMYTALKLLDKDVELVEFIGEDHGINRRTPRLLWWQTYMAFFDKHLKDQPEWWDSLYE